MKEGQNCNYEKKGAYKTAKRLPVKKRKEKKRKEQRKADKGRKLQILKKTNNAHVAISLESIVVSCCFWICCSHYTPLLTDRSDWKEHNMFDRYHHLEFHGKQKGNAPARQFGRWPISLLSTVGSFSFLDMWCAQMLPSLWTVEIGKYCSGKVSCMLNSSSSIFK